MEYEFINKIDYVADMNDIKCIYKTYYDYYFDNKSFEDAVANYEFGLYNIIENKLLNRWKLILFQKDYTFKISQCSFCEEWNGINKKCACDSIWLEWSINSNWFELLNLNKRLLFDDKIIIEDFTYDDLKIIFTVIQI